MTKFNLGVSSEYQEAHKLLIKGMMSDQTVEISAVKNKRTNRQNNSIHQLFTELADELNSSGLYLTKVLKKDVDVPWSAELTKEFLWRPIMKAVTGKESTTEMTTGEVDKVFEILQKHLGENFGIELKFPSYMDLIRREDEQTIKQ